MAFPGHNGGDGGACGEDFVDFEDFGGFEVFFCDGDVSGGVECEELGVGLFFDYASGGGGVLAVVLGRKRGGGTHPWIISSRNCSRPSWTSLTSTFLRHAFFPLREGCFEAIVAFDMRWGGSSAVEGMEEREKAAGSWRCQG